MPETDGVVVTRRYDASPERVFDAFLDPEVARLFLFATRDGEVVRAELDPRVGGRFVIVDRRPGPGEVEHVGEYVEIDRPSRLAFLFGVPAFSPETSRVTIDIAADGDGAVLTLTHERVMPDQRARSEDGWRRILAGLLPAYAGVKAAGSD